MAATFLLEIVTPERVFFTGQVEMVVLKTPQGELGILAGHMPLVCAVDVGTTRIKKDSGEWVEAVLNEGFMQVTQEKAVIFTDTAEWPEEIDENRAQLARQRAEERLSQRNSHVEYARSQAALARAVARLKVKKQIR